tara:strand:+ start:132 stop:668 length:537 start_codon:yes stop_codon:yes gene_type:complete
MLISIPVGWKAIHECSYDYHWDEFNRRVHHPSQLRRGMLPDTLHELPRDERFAYAKLLAYMINIDDEVTIDEMTVFEQRLGTALLSPSQRKMIRTYLKEPPSMDECLEGLGEVSGRLALRDAALMTAADGSIDEDEQIALEKIAAHLNLDNEIVDKLLDWVSSGYDWMQDGLDLLNVE